MDIQERNQKILENDGLITFVLNKWFPHRVGFQHIGEIQDIKQQCRLAMMRGAEHFDESKSKWSTYIVVAILREMHRMLNGEGLIRLPAISRKKIAPRLKPLRDQARRIHSISHGDAAIDPAQSGRNNTDQTPDRKEMEERKERLREEVREQLPDAMEWALRHLDPRDARIMQWRAEGYTLDVIGKWMGITKERARQLEVRALKRLRDIPRLQALWDLLQYD